MTTETKADRQEPHHVFNTTVRTLTTDKSVSRAFQFVRGGVKVKEKVPDWKQRIADGKDATGEYSVFGTRFRETPGWGQVDVKDFTGYKSFQAQGYVMATIGEPSDPALMSYVSEDNAALAKFYSKLRGVSQAASLQPMILEGRQTLSMLAQVGTKLAAAGQAYKSGMAWIRGKAQQATRLGPASKASKRAVKSVSKRAAGAHLELTFGWLPLIEDVKDLAEALRRLNDQEVVERVHAPNAPGEGKITVTVSDPWWSSQNNYLYWRTTQKMTQQVKVVYLAAVRQKVYNSVTAQMVDLLGLNPAQIVPAIWEWTPWSWAVDYFTNVGDLLDVYFTPVGDVIWANKSVKRLYRIERSCGWDADKVKSVLAQFYAGSAGSGSSAKLERFSFFRTRLSVGALPRPTFQYELPSLKKAKNLLAVFTQRVAR